MHGKWSHMTSKQIIRRLFNSSVFEEYEMTDGSCNQFPKASPCVMLLVLMKQGALLHQK